MFDMGTDWVFARKASPLSESDAHGAIIGDYETDIADVGGVALVVIRA
jgi:hypothetical protein